MGWEEDTLVMLLDLAWAFVLPLAFLPCSPLVFLTPLLLPPLIKPKHFSKVSQGNISEAKGAHYFCYSHQSLSLQI